MVRAVSQADRNANSAFRRRNRERSSTRNGARSWSCSARWLSEGLSGSLYPWQAKCAQPLVEQGVENGVTRRVRADQDRGAGQESGQVVGFGLRAGQVRGVRSVRHRDDQQPRLVPVVAAAGAGVSQSADRRRRRGDDAVEEHGSAVAVMARRVQGQQAERPDRGPPDPRPRTVRGRLGRQPQLAEHRARDGVPQPLERVVDRLLGGQPSLRERGVQSAHAVAHVLFAQPVQRA